MDKEQLPFAVGTMKSKEMQVKQIQKTGARQVAVFSLLAEAVAIIADSDMLFQ